MQATQTTRRFDAGQIKRFTIAAGLLASLAISAAALDAADSLPGFGGTDTRSVAAPQITSDELYALEASQADAQVNGWSHRVPRMSSDEAFAYEAGLELARVTGGHATLRQMTSDEAWALEASMIALAEAHGTHTITQLTSDEAWAIEQAQLLASPSEQRAGR
jgi:hypothetical protein